MKQDLKNQMEKDIAFLEPPPGITVQPVGNFDIMTSPHRGLVHLKG